MGTWAADPRVVRYLVNQEKWVRKDGMMGLPGADPGTFEFLEGMRYVHRSGLNGETIMATQELRDLYADWRWAAINPSMGTLYCPDEQWAHVVAKDFVQRNPTESAKVLQLRAVHRMKMPDPQPKPEHIVETFQ